VQSTSGTKATNLLQHASANIARKHHRRKQTLRNKPENAVQLHPNSK
jgi:hypothetical protein